MNENFVIELGDAKDVTKSPHLDGCVIDGVNPVTYLIPRDECPPS